MNKVFGSRYFRWAALAVFLAWTASVFQAAGCDAPPPQCGSIRRPHSDPSCPCVDYALSVPDPGWGLASCRPDQGAEVLPAQPVSAGKDRHAGNAVLFCTCTGDEP